jgi:catecholate siderophore receptor
MACLATSIALALPAVAMAADTPATGADDGYLIADAGNTTQLPTIPVEGNSAPSYKVDTLASPKFVKPLVDTTQTIQIISSDIIRDQGATTLTEALRNSPGVGTFYTGENGNTTTGDTVYLRGYDASSSIYVDGVRDLGSISRDVFNIEQVELTKGAAGTDNGRSSPSGAINLVSKQPMLEDAVSGSVALGTSSQKRITADLNKTIDSASGSAFRLSLMAQDSGVPGRDQLEQDRWGFAPSLAFGLAGSTRFYLNYLHVKQSNVPDGGVFTIGLPGYSTPDASRPELGLAPPVDPENFYGTDADHDDVKADMFTARVEHDFSEDLKFQNTTRWGPQRAGLPADLLPRQYRKPADPGHQTIRPAWTIARSIPTFKDHTNRILTNQSNLRVHSGSGSFENDFSGGVEFTREELDTRDARILDGGIFPAANVYNPDPHVAAPLYGPSGAKGSGSSDTLALYAFDTVTFNERWQMNGGVRLDRFDADFDSTLVCGTGGAPACGDLAAWQHRSRRGCRHLRHPVQLEARRAVQTSQQRQPVCQLHDRRTATGWRFAGAELAPQQCEQRHLRSTGVQDRRNRHQVGTGRQPPAAECGAVSHRHQQRDRARSGRPAVLPDRRETRAGHRAQRHRSDQ